MIRSYSTLTCCCLLMTLLSNKHLCADLILTYDLQGSNGISESIAPHGTTSSQVAGLSMTRGTGLVASTGGFNGTNSFSAAGWDSLTSHDYVRFGFQVNPGFRVAVESVQFRVSSQLGGPAAMGMFTSQDNYNSAVGTFNLSSSVTSHTINVGSLQPATGLLEFRFYALGAEAIGGGSTSPSVAVMFGNYTPDRNIQFFQVNGSITAVPEPSALLLIGAAVPLMALSFRRYRSRAANSDAAQLKAIAATRTVVYINPWHESETHANYL